MYYICIICVLYVFLLALSGFSWVFCARGDFCLCFCWLYPAFLGFFASAAIFVCVFAGLIRLFLGFLRPRRFLYVFLLAFASFSWVFGVRGDFCMCFCWFFLAFWYGTCPGSDARQLKLIPCYFGNTKGNLIKNFAHMNISIYIYMYEYIYIYIINDLFIL